MRKVSCYKTFADGVGVGGACVERGLGVAEFLEVAVELGADGDGAGEGLVVKVVVVAPLWGFLAGGGEGLVDCEMSVNMSFRSCSGAYHSRA